MVSPCQIFSTLVHPSRKYCNFSISQNGHYSHLVFSNSQNFIGWWGPEGRDASPCQIFVKNWKNPLWRYCDFSILQDGRRLHFGFLNSWIFITWLGPKVKNTSSCQISWKLVNPLWRYCNFSFFDMAAVRHLDLFGAHLHHPWRVLGGLSLCKIWLWSMQ